MMNVRLGSLLHVHHRMIVYILMVKNVWSQFIMICLVTTVPINIYLLVSSYVSRLPLAEKMVFIVISLTLLFTMSLTMSPLATLTETIHSIRKCFVPLQTTLTWRPLKFKIQLYHELINANQYFGYQASIFGVVTHRKIFEVSEPVVVCWH